MQQVRIDDKADANEMLCYQHSGFSVDAGVCIEADERAALVYRCTKQQSEPSSDRRGARADELHLTPLELIARIAALVPPPRTHRHRYFGVLAPNSPHRAAVTALATPAQPAKQVVVQSEPATTGEGAPGVTRPGQAIPPTPEPAPDAPVAALLALPTAPFDSEPATRAGNTGFARGSKPVPGARYFSPCG